MSQRRSARGRGLGALISSSPSTESSTDRTERSRRGSVSETAGTAQPSAAPAAVPTPDGVDTEVGHDPSESGQTTPLELDVDRIDPNPDQPRREFEPESLQNLARSIGQHGVLQPVVVRQAGDRYELIMGERRFRATQLAGRKTIPAVVADIAADDRLELAIVENVQREDLNPIELALAYRALAMAGHTQDEIGQKVSMDRSSIANHIRLLDLSRGIQTDVENGRLSMGHAKALLQVPDPETREALRGRILRESLSVRAAERAARELTGKNGAPKPRKKETSAPSAPLDADTRAFVERIERRLQTKVTLQPAADGSGRIVLNYFNLEDLERLGDLLLGEGR